MNEEQIAAVLAMHQHYEYTKNLGYYRSEYECECGETLWGGEHEGEPRVREVFAAHQAKALAQ